MKWICEPGCSRSKPVLKGHGWTLLTGTLMMLMPKCVFCWAAYMSVLSSLGISAIPYKPWYVPLVITLFIITLAKLLYNAISNGRYVAFAMALIAGAAIVAQKLWIPFDALGYIAMAMMIIAVWMDFFVWLYRATWRRKRITLPVTR